MTTKTVRLSFRAPVHFGNGRLSDSAFNCDAATLFSALYIEARRLGMEAGLLEAAHNGDLTLSDTFPYIEDRLYLPRPMVPIRLELDDQNFGAKELRKTRYIPAHQYGVYVSGNMNLAQTRDEFSLGVSVAHTKVDLTGTQEKDSAPYQVGSYYFNNNAGIYFIYQGDYDLEPILEQLQYSGLGGRRTSGYGRFSYNISNDNPIDQAMQNLSPESSKPGYVLLASAMPAEEEITDDFLDGAHYGLIRKSGFIQSTEHSSNPQKKQDCYVFASGSYFTKPFDGDVFDVNPYPNAHEVFRYARAMWMEV